MLKVLNSIANEISKVYTTAPIYIQSVPQGFKRPSFFVQYVNGDSESISKRLYQNTMTFQIVYFGAYNDFNGVDADLQLIEMQKIADIFNTGYIPVVDSDRVAKIPTVNLRIQDGEVYVLLTIEYTDEKILPPHHSDNEEMMQDFKYKVK